MFEQHKALLMDLLRGVFLKWCDHGAMKGFRRACKLKLIELGVRNVDDIANETALRTFAMTVRDELKRFA